jgi:phosphomannomutase
MPDILIFDIDGTLTPPRQKMNALMADVLLGLSLKKKIYFVTGSDYAKVIQQVPDRVLRTVEGLFTCSGNQLFIRGMEVYSRIFSKPAGLWEFLNKQLIDSPWQEKTSCHLELRAGMLNFSTIGRSCTREQREAYNEWDKTQNERKSIAWNIERMFPNLSAAVGGEISIDIYEKGCDKSQAIRYIRNIHKDSTMHFFGDKLQPGGNDHPICAAMILSKNGKEADRITQVQNWEDTLNHIEAYIYE